MFIRLSYAIFGAGFMGASNILFEHYHQQNISREASKSITQSDVLRKQKIVASVYNTMGLNLLPEQISIAFYANVRVPIFFHNASSQSISLKLPRDMEHNDLAGEAQLVAASARQAAHDKSQHRLLNPAISGGAAGFTYAASRAHTPRAFLLSIGALGVMSCYMQYRALCQADKMAIRYFPDYIEEMIQLMKKNQRNTNQLTWYNQRRYANILDNLRSDNKEYNKRYSEVLRGLSLHRRRFDLVKPEEKYPHPLTRAYKEEGLHLDKSQVFAINRLNHSARVYIPVYAEPILREFFEYNKSQATPLGELYREMSFSDFIERLTTKTFKSIYLDGRVLHGRHHHEERLLKALPKYPNSKVMDNLNLLTKIGGYDDTEGVFQDYLSLEEIAMKSLLIEQAVCLPIGDGRRDTEYSEASKSDMDFKLPVIDSLSASARVPVSLASVSGIEARNGHSVHPDLFMIFIPEKPNNLWNNMTKSLRESSYYKVSNKIYGDKLALDFTPGSQDKDFVLFGDGEYHEKWYICTSAYKQRMKLLYRSLLTTADKQMQDYDLGDSYNLKGLGLGYFGFNAATSILENLSKEALQEALNEIKLKHIKRINLINWPSQMEQANQDLPLHKQQYLTQVATISDIEIYAGISETFSSLGGSNFIGGTHACGDSASQFGNEARIGMPPSSSDEAATYYATLDSDSLVADENPELSLRLKVITR